MIGGGLLVALLAASVMGYGSAIPGVSYCYTSCVLSVSSSISSGGTSSTTAPFTVIFAGTASGGTGPYTWSWNFGDGSTSGQQNPTHTFAQTGTFNVVLTVQDANGNRGTASALQICVGGSSCPNNQPQGNSADNTNWAILVAGVVIVIVVALALVLLILQRRRRSREAELAMQSGAMAAAAYEPAPQMYVAAPPAQDPTSMEPPPEGAPGAVLPPPPTSDDIPAGSPNASLPPPPPPSSDDISGGSYGAPPAPSPPPLS